MKTLEKQEWKFKDLFCDPDGSLSHTKIWANVGNSVLSISFIYEAYLRGITPELIISYGVVIGGYRLTSKYLDMKGTQYANNNPVDAPKVEL